MKIVLLLLTLLDARITTLDGTVIEGRLSALSTDSVTLEPASSDDPNTKTLPLADVVDIRFTDATTKADGGMELLLHDESRIPCEAATATAVDVAAGSPWLADLTLSRSAVHAIRLQSLNPDWGPQWEALLARGNEKDLLVRVKRDGSGLDFIDGVVSSVSSEQVTFLLDGDEIPVPRDRVFAIIFSRLDIDKSPLKGALAIHGSSDEAVKVRDVTLTGSTFDATTSWGQSISVDASHVSRIDFSNSRFHYLSDLNPIEERYFGTQPQQQDAVSIFPEDEATRTGPLQFWRMSKDAFPYGDGGRPPLMLRGRVYRKGLCIFPHAKIVYAVDGKYAQLTARIGVDDEVAFNSPDPENPYAVSLTVEGDGIKLVDRQIEASADPVPLDVDIAGVRTLTLVVDFGDGRNFCDYLDIADAKLILADEK